MQVAVVTGGTRGIGLAICRRLARDGFAVLTMSRDAAVADAAAERLRDDGADAEAFAGDVAVEGVADEAVARAVARWGGLDVMVNNAGTIAVGPVVDEPVERWDRVMAVNLRGTFLGCRAAARQMIAQGRGGRILNASSAAGRRGDALTAAYNASKFGVVGFTQSLAVELAPHGITVNAYCPGNVTTTGMWDEIDDAVQALNGSEPGAAKRDFVLNQPIARSGTEDEVAAVVGFLASPESSFVTGAAYLVDGGLARV